MADGLPERGEGLAEDEPGAVAGDGGTSEEHPGEQDEEDEGSSNGCEDPACLDVDCAELLTNGGERWNGGTSGEEDRCAETTAAEAGLEPLELDATTSEQLSFGRGGDGLALALGIEGGQVIDDAAGEGADDVLRDELDSGTGQGAERADGDDRWIAEAVAVEYLERLHDEAVRLIEAVGLCERFRDCDLGDEARVGLGGAADPRECALGGIGGAAGEESTGAIELVGEFVEQQLVRSTCGFGHAMHLG